MAKRYVWLKQFFKENVRYPVLICRNPICLILGTQFSLLLGTDDNFLWFEGPESGPWNTLKKPWLNVFNNSLLTALAMLVLHLPAKLLFHINQRRTTSLLSAALRLFLYIMAASVLQIFYCFQLLMFCFYTLPSLPCFHTSVWPSFYWVSSYTWLNDMCMVTYIFVKCNRLWCGCRLFTPDIDHSSIFFGAHWLGSCVWARKQRSLDATNLKLCMFKPVHLIIHFMFSVLINCYHFLLHFTNALVSNCIVDN